MKSKERYSYNSYLAINTETGTDPELGFGSCNLNHSNAFEHSVVIVVKLGFLSYLQEVHSILLWIS